MDGSLKKSLSSNSMPSLISRLDHLDSMMNYLDGRKYSSARWANDGAVVKKECVPLDLALKEAQSKGSILERITSLEQQLIQLCLDIESEGGSPSRNSQREQNATSPLISRKGFSNSFSRFRLSHLSHNQKGTKNEEHDTRLEPSSEASQRRKNMKTKDEKASPKQKKVVPSSLLHLRLLGC
ncbi:uncharacterized protein LOC104892915 isoform X2 [Beta vulgaris subsp. vulgaris]|uniref:uncharacterized protein LOC104892915 isoform X2 n=1 Tax=Beta vulgaris subsp. vulgaris TaxID=3555 RepID=UPI0020376042|nr:uncharacterized protein LOC104892915 isoform X2 [Beta vulgaris subsp. vulgaris]